MPILIVSHLLDVFAKKTNKTPISAIKRCQQRLKQYDEVTKEQTKSDLL